MGDINTLKHNILAKLGTDQVIHCEAIPNGPALLGITINFKGSDDGSGEITITSLEMKIWKDPLNVTKVSFDNKGQNFAEINETMLDITLADLKASGNDTSLNVPISGSVKKISKGMELDLHVDISALMQGLSGGGRICKGQIV